jgi:hypothetical protein
MGQVLAELLPLLNLLSGPEMTGTKESVAFSNLQKSYRGDSREYNQPSFFCHMYKMFCSLQLICREIINSTESV